MQGGKENYFYFGFGPVGLTLSLLPKAV